MTLDDDDKTRPVNRHTDATKGILNKHRLTTIKTQDGNIQLSVYLIVSLGKRS